MKEQQNPCKVIQAFLQDAVLLSDLIYMGIDCGANGAIGLICKHLQCVVDIPTIKVETIRHKKTTEEERIKTGYKTKTKHGKTTKFDFGGICDIFTLLRKYKKYIIIMLEEVPISMGPGKKYGEILLNRAYAMWPLYLYSQGFHFKEVLPTVWKRQMKLYGKDKDACRLKALSLFPKAKIKLKKHHDRAEALLLAEFLRRIHEN